MQLAELHQGGKEPCAGDKYGLWAVRGCEVMEMKDEGGRLMNDYTGEAALLCTLVNPLLRKLAGRDEKELCCTLT